MGVVCSGPISIGHYHLSNSARVKCIDQKELEGLKQFRPQILFFLLGRVEIRRRLSILNRCYCYIMSTDLSNLVYSGNTKEIENRTSSTNINQAV